MLRDGRRPGRRPLHPESGLSAPTLRGAASGKVARLQLSLRRPVLEADLARGGNMRGHNPGSVPVSCVVAALALFALAPARADTPGRERSVNVYNWSDYIDPAVLDAFTKETGIKVRYDT